MADRLVWLNKENLIEVKLCDYKNKNCFDTTYGWGGGESSYFFVSISWIIITEIHTYETEESNRRQEFWYDVGFVSCLSLFVHPQTAIFCQSQSWTKYAFENPFLLCLGGHKINTYYINFPSVHQSCVTIIYIFYNQFCTVSTYVTTTG